MADNHYKDVIPLFFLLLRCWPHWWLSYTFRYFHPLKKKTGQLESSSQIGLEQAILYPMFFVQSFGRHSKSWGYPHISFFSWTKPSKTIGVTQFAHLLESIKFSNFLSTGMICPRAVKRSWKTLALNADFMAKHLVGGFNPSEKYEAVGMIIPNICKNNKCSKPPTRHL